ncbi:hypothetical protein [Paracoccus sp. SM22M-07]|uniref:hypothetical protein n=1 Tax=Paracoccus sp. SM22M-07 TaxID=1520813 RepID=UPI00091E9512|nr:hypothetical protein [Paracoccus sp. SM22M-07]OJH45182.1 hypothetical protein IE00_05850 [Paracoccus sp. SM22M-07]
MCIEPDIEDPKQMQASKAPVFSSTATTQSKSGRKGTLLAPTAPQQPAMAASAPTQKKTLLGA